MPVLSISNTLKRVEFLLVLSIFACAGIFIIHPISASLRPADYLPRILLTLSYIFVLYSTDRKFGFQDKGILPFAVFYFLIFNSFFFSLGIMTVPFFLFFLSQLILSNLIIRLFSSLIITGLYSLYYFVFIGASYWRDFSIWFFFAAFLFSSGLTMVVRSRYRDKNFIRRILKKRDSVTTLHNISKTISSGAPIQKIMYKITESLGLFTNVVRSSIILVDQDYKHAKIAASFEGEQIRNMPIQIDKYPEILMALKTGMIVTIPDIGKSPLMQKVKADMKPITGQSVMVIPLKYGGENLGVLFLRGHREGKGFSKEEINFCETAATLSGQVLFAARLYEELKEKSVELKKMVKQLEEANRMKSIFVANVSHELRTPLTSIIGYLQLLTDVRFSETENLMHIETVKKNADMLLLLINELIDITKIEAGTFELFYEKGNINDLVQFVCESIKPKLDRSGIRLDLKLNKFEEEFFFDVNRIEQVLNNILNNAIKFSPDGTTITLSTTFENKWAQVSIKDQGIGISEKDQKRIFDRFVQAEASFAREKSGAGIGLHLCREIIGFHKGKIWVESKSKKGATFHFKIPIVISAEKLKDSVTIGL